VHDSGKEDVVDERKKVSSRRLAPDQKSSNKEDDGERSRFSSSQAHEKKFVLRFLPENSSIFPFGAHPSLCLSEKSGKRYELNWRQGIKKGRIQSVGQSRAGRGQRKKLSQKTLFVSRKREFSHEVPTQKKRNREGGWVIKPSVKRITRQKERTTRKK